MCTRRTKEGDAGSHVEKSCADAFGSDAGLSRAEQQPGIFAWRWRQPWQPVHPGARTSTVQRTKQHRREHTKAKPPAPSRFGDEHTSLQRCNPMQPTTAPQRRTKKNERKGSNGGLARKRREGGAHTQSTHSVLFNASAQGGGGGRPRQGRATLYRPLRACCASRRAP